MNLNRDNWFLVLPTVVLGIVASYTLYHLHAAGDVRRAIEIVAEYEADGQPTLAEFLAQRGRLAWESEVVSSFYGTMDVACIVGSTNPQRFVWRVHVVQKAFAPADDRTRALMGEYEPSLYGEPTEAGSSPHISTPSCCGRGEARVYGVALGRAPRRMVKYVSGAFPARALYPRASPRPRDEGR